MSDKVDRKLQEVRIAEYHYRHEAEFAAGFLDDAGIPYRLQRDDAGGADLGLSMLRPSAIWVRAVDVAVARDVLALEEDEYDGSEPSPGAPEPATPVVVGGERPSVTKRAGLAGQERVVSAGLSVALFSALPYLPFGPYREYFAGFILAGCVGFLVGALAGRAPRPFEWLVRALSGSFPE